VRKMRTFIVPLAAAGAFSVGKNSAELIWAMVTQWERLIAQLSRSLSGARKLFTLNVAKVCNLLILFMFC
jgi:hypothetical protein